MNRRSLRTNILKSLYLTEFYPDDEKESQVQLYLDTELENEAEESRKYILEKTMNVLEKAPEADMAINEAAKGWTTERMNITDLAILRLAYYEMFYDEDVPVSVAINEAVELSKLYCDDGAPAFVNGVLASLSAKGR